ncbi:MAG: serine/threonine-protein kinase [Acidimicrobiales bacterium]
MDSEHALGAQMRAGSMLAGRYRLVAPIATGGMAQVWQAEDTVLGRRVAAKVLHPHLATDQAFLLRFRREAIAAARLSHRSIVGIYDTVSDDGNEAIIMELIEGRTMRAVLDEAGPMPVADVIDIGVQVAEALGEAHRGGVVHRDIKPSNILLCADRRVMVTDFGIAKAGEDTDLTVTGTLLGTAKYLSPEQVLGDDVDPRSDLYSLGVVLYEAIAGRAPFRAETDAATALARLHQQPRPLQEFRRDLPAALISIIDRLLARDPADRWMTAIEARTALAALDRSPVTPTTPPGANQDATRTITTPEPLPSVAPSASINDHVLNDHEFGGSEFDDHEHSFLRSEQSWLVPALIVLVLAAALVLAGILFTTKASIDFGGDTPSVSGDETSETTVLTPTNELVEATVAGLSTIDPPAQGGDGEENDALLPLAIDGDRNTVWRSDRYNGPGFAGLKPGIGLLIDLGGTARVSQLDLETNGEGWAVEIYVGDDFSGPIDTWGEPIGGGSDLDGRESFDFDSARGTQLLVWITEPGTSPDRNDDGIDDYRFELEEISVES